MRTQPQGAGVKSVGAPPGCRLRARKVPGAGRVLEAVLSGRRDPEFWEALHRVFGEEVARRPPDYLVLDLRGLDCIIGSSLLGGLVSAAVAMEDAGRPGRTRLVAAGVMAERLEGVVRLCKLEPILGRVHPDLASALAAGPH